MPKSNVFIALKNAMSEQIEYILVTICKYLFGSDAVYQTLGIITLDAA